MKPKLCMMVLYDEPASCADGPPRESYLRSALVTRVYVDDPDMRVDLTVFPPMLGSYSVAGVKYGRWTFQQ